MRKNPPEFPELEAILLDVDGTLYRQPPVRARVALHLLAAHALRPRLGWRTLRLIAAYRSAQEQLRQRPADGELAAAQLRLASQRAGVPLDAAELLLRRWMQDAPLGPIARAARRGLRDFLEAARARGLGLAVVSDYPASAKLRALGVDDLIAVRVGAQDPAVQRFKPDPRGLRVALERLGVSAERALYVGDRPDVDGPAARAAGVAVLILGTHRRADVAGFPELRDRLFGGARGTRD